MLDELEIKPNTNKKWNDLKMRQGKFSIHQDLIELNPDAVMLLFQKMIVCRAEFSFLKRAIEYIAVSPLFDVVELGSEIPEYTCMITRKEDGSLDISFKKY